MVDAPLGLFNTCRAAFDSTARDVEDAGRTFGERLAHADPDAGHATALAALARARQKAEGSIAVLTSLTEHVEKLHAEWLAARRYTDEVLARRVTQLAAKVAADDAGGAREWLTEVFDALDDLEWRAVEVLAGDEVAWPSRLCDGAKRIRDAVARWGAGEQEAGLELMEVVAEATLAGWEAVVSPELRSRAHRLAAWVWLRRLKKADPAEKHLDAAVGLWPFAGRMHAERAAYYLCIGDLDRAATDAQRSVELAKDDAYGYMELGIWAELSGDFEDADGFYRKSLELLPAFDVARLTERASLMDPPGRLLMRAAGVLLEAQRPSEALVVANQALQSDLRGPELHPQVSAHELRSRALEHLDRTKEAAGAAAKAGELHAWNGEVDEAITQFKRALELDDGRADVGWLLADARLTKSLPRGARKTNQVIVTEACETWERWAEKVGPPRGDTSWAYLTRAMIADLGTQQPGAARLAGLSEAALYVEKAILHDDVDAQRWGYAAQYLRYLHLDELAYEAADRGYELSSGDRQVLAQRLAQLIDRAELAEAEHVAEELTIMFGNDPWVSAAKAWVAIHGERDDRYHEGLSLLDLPLSGGNDPSWYYEMRALCHVGLKDVDAAREDFRELLKHALPVDGTTKSRLEVAAVAIGELELAAHWSGEASKDSTSRAVGCLAADAFAAFARGDLVTAEEQLSRATVAATSVSELRHIADMLLRLPLLPPDDLELQESSARVVRSLVAGPLSAREASLKHNATTPDQELEEPFARYAERPEPPRVFQTTLLAVKARRHLQARRLREAVDSYHKLLSTSFEPEATIGFTRALQTLADERAAKGDVDQVRQLTERMTALADVGPTEVAAIMATALEQSGDRPAARKQLEDALAIASDAGNLALLHQRAGGLALADAELGAASAHFQAALETTRDDPGLAGQVQIRMALIAILRDDTEAAGDHLRAAGVAWKEGGALDPTAALIGELDGLQRLRNGPWKHAARDALKLVETAVAPDLGQRHAESPLEPLRRELDGER